MTTKSTWAVGAIAFVFCVGFFVSRPSRTVHGQNLSRTVTAAATVYNYRPVMFQTPCPASGDGTNPCQIIPQSGSNPAFAIVQMINDPVGTAYPSGTPVAIATGGEVTLEFDGPPQTGYTAVALNGYGHFDSSIQNDSQVCSDKSAFGRIQRLRPDLGANLATINFRETASRGTMLCPSSPGITAAVQAVQNQPVAQVQSDWNSISAPSAILNKPTIPTNTNQLTNGSGYLTAPVANASLANPSTTVNGQTCTLGGTCTVAFPVTYYTPAGAALTGVKHIVSGAVATTSAGAWSVTYSAVGCTTIRSANVSVISPTGNLATQQYTPYIQTLTTTGVSGVVYSGAVLSLLGATLVPITVATTVYVDVSCT